MKGEYTSDISKTITSYETPTKQKEIREVMDLYTDDGCMYPDRVCNALGSGYCSSNEEAYRCLMERLTELGVVIKVGEKELKAGETYMAYLVEPLVKEGT